MELREIKFRALNTKGAWIYGMPTYDMKYMFEQESVNSVDNYVIDPKTVGQYTDLKDKNGKDIYEGDVVKDSENRNHTIVFSHGTFRSHKTNTIYSISWEIIGNIHQNPELI